jgi:hypothetical protein
LEKPFKVGLKKVSLAIEESNDETLLAVWSRSQSELSFSQWKEKLQKGDKGSKTSTTSNITGKDLARM